MKVHGRWLAGTERRAAADANVDCRSVCRAEHRAQSARSVDERSSVALSAYASRRWGYERL